VAWTAYNNRQVNMNKDM